jgi:hypothetical protein
MSAVCDAENVDTLSLEFGVDESKSLEVLRLLAMFAAIRARNLAVPSQIKLISTWMALHSPEHTEVMKQHRVSVEMFKKLDKDCAKVLSIEFSVVNDLKKQLKKNPDVPDAPQLEGKPRGEAFDPNQDGVCGVLLSELRVSMLILAQLQQPMPRRTSG